MVQFQELSFEKTKATVPIAAAELLTWKKLYLAAFFLSSAGSVTNCQVAAALKFSSSANHLSPPFFNHLNIKGMAIASYRLTRLA